MIDDFEIIKQKGEELYKNLGEIYCPYFKEKISFNARGLEHLKFKSYERPRPTKDQRMRFRLLHLAPEILTLTHTLQGVWETKVFEKIRVNSRTDTIWADVSYFEFIAVVNRNRVKVVIKQINSGKKFFWSIIPFWRMKKSTVTRILHEGDPEID